MSNENLPPSSKGGEEEVPRNQKGEPLWPRPPRKPLTGWVLLFPIVLLLGAIWINSGARPGSESPPAIDNAMQSPVVETSPGGNIGNTLPQTISPVKEEVVLYLPNDQAELTRRTVPLSKLLGSGLNAVPAQFFEVVGREALEYVFTESPDYFPKGTRVESLRKEGNLVTLDLPADFATAPLWSQGDSFGLVATGSIVNTLASVAGGGKLAPVKVKFLSGGKPFELLGEFDMTGPLEPNPTLVTAP